MPFFLIMEYPKAGSDFLTFTYCLKLFNTCRGFVGGFVFVGVVLGLFVCLFFPMDRLKSGPYKYLVHDSYQSVSADQSKRHQTDSVHNWRHIQVLPV